MWCGPGTKRIQESEVILKQRPARLFLLFLNNKKSPHTLGIRTAEFEHSPSYEKVTNLRNMELRSTPDLGYTMFTGQTPH